MPVNGARKLSDFAEWEQGCELLVKVQLELLENEKNQSVLRGSIEGESSRRREDGLTQKALAYLDGESDVFTIDTTDARYRKLSELQEAAKLLHRAEEICRSNIEKLRTTLSDRICEPLKGEHCQLVRAVIDAARALAVANQAEHEFRERLDIEGVHYMPHLRPMPFAPARIGRLSEDFSGVSTFIAEAVEFGFLTEGEAAKMRNGGVSL